MATMTMSSDPVAEADAAVEQAKGTERGQAGDAGQLMAVDEAGTPWHRPTGRELSDAGHEAQVSGRAYETAVAAREVARSTQQRELLSHAPTERAEAERRQRRAALARYLEKVAEAAYLWLAVVEAGPVAGLSPATASPEGVAAFKAWTDRNVP